MNPAVELTPGQWRAVKNYLETCAIVATDRVVIRQVESNVRAFAPIDVEVMRGSMHMRFRARLEEFTDDPEWQKKHFDPSGPRR